MKNSLEITKSIFEDHLRDFESADAVYVAAEREFVNFDLDHGTSDEMKAVREKLQSARDDREYYAVALCKYLWSCKDFICFEANPDVLENSPADAPEDSSVDTLEDVPEVDSNSPADAPEDALEVASEVDPEDVVAADPDSPADAPEDALEVASEVDPEDVVAADPDSPADALEDIFPVMSAKCKLCPSCVDGRCFFVPDQYDNEFPCLSPAWDNFFRGGSHTPASRERASPAR